MSSVLNIDRFIIPNDVIVSLTSIYRWIGQNSFFTDTVKSDLDKVVEQTVERDAYFLSLILKLNISDTRSRLIITKNSKPRTKDESILFNIKASLNQFQSYYKSLRHQSNDLLSLVNFIYDGSNTKFDYIDTYKKSVLKSQSNKSKRLILDKINEEIDVFVEKNSYEKITLYLNFFVDFCNIEPFTDHNQTASLFLIYLLVLKSDIEAFRYISFFEILYDNFEEFETELMNASFNWKEGFAQTIGFIRFFTKLLIKAYAKSYLLIKDYKFEDALNKGDNIENTITKLPEIFTKEEIRLIHPYVSESTINRALIRLRDNGSIKPLGKGRSAKWIRIERNY